MFFGGGNLIRSTYVTPNIHAPGLAILGVSHSQKQLLPTEGEVAAWLMFLLFPPNQFRNRVIEQRSTPMRSARSDSARTPSPIVAAWYPIGCVYRLPSFQGWCLRLRWRGSGP